MGWGDAGRARDWGPAGGLGGCRGMGGRGWVLGLGGARGGSPASRLSPATEKTYGGNGNMR
ncbi:hypothetical protein TIFTF001_017381 [Ficus carica]|uniref:Uncharacterized protein n=1 Tax=Ficus carica TaxID=3494 RepID=A0AA88D6Y0_FICCA|nr:hypothetical protein TIFTF001_017381 [Ficus carica]